jgi:outer membrane receptor for ferrienterochelin and colicin
MKTWISRAVLAAAIAAPVAEVAAAQQPAAQPDAGQPGASQGVRVFEPAFFARYNPITAFDMVRQVPGFSLDNGDSLRGFGATAGNVLIDGRRPSSKNAISDELNRISARDVARIEIIGAAAAGDVDVRGYTELANVILKPAAGTQVSTTWRGDLQFQGEHLSERLGGTRQWKTADMTVRLNAQLSNGAQRQETGITVSNASGAVTSTREEFNQQYFGELLLNGTLNWTPTARDTVNLTGRLMPRTVQRNFASEAFYPSGALTVYSVDDYPE